MGVLGALALVVILLAIIRVIYINCQNAAEVAMAYSTLSSALVLVSVSFGIWQNWWLAALMLIGLSSVFSNLTSRKKLSEEIKISLFYRLSGPKTSGSEESVNKKFLCRR